MANNRNCFQSSRPAIGAHRIKRSSEDCLFKCIQCRTYVGTYDDLVSKAFQGRHGRAYLLTSLMNVQCGAVIERVLTTGRHRVANISCVTCKKILGWKYVLALELSQKYKEGKFILEKSAISIEDISTDNLTEYGDLQWS